MARTKGARNKRSVGIPAELAEKLGHRDPAEVLGEIYSMDLKQLQKAVRSAAGARAMKLKLDAAVAAMPYKHSKMPVKVEVNEEQLPHVSIRRDTNSQQNQQLIDRAGATVLQPIVSPEGQAIEKKGQ